MTVKSTKGGSADVFGASGDYLLDGEDVRHFLASYFPLETLRGKRVFDAGCRMGEFISLLSELGARAEGVDLSEAIIAEARSRHPALVPAFHVADVRDLSRFEQSAYDIVLCLGVLCYLKPDQWLPALRELARLCKDDGRMLVLFQNERGPVARSIVAIVNVIPAQLYLHVVCPVAAALLAPMSGFLLGKRIRSSALRYRVLMSLRGLHFGFPAALAGFRVATPTSGFVSVHSTAAFLLQKKDVEAICASRS